MIIIGSEGGEHVSIIPIGSINRDEWFQAEASISVNGFKGSISPYIEISDISRFHNEIVKLYDNLDGVAELKPIEGQFGLTLKGDGKGHIEVKGNAYTHATYGSCLNFVFEVDQTHLPKLIKSIEHVLKSHAKNT